jgi:hypothetical protein
MQIVIDENIDDQEWVSHVGEISFETDNDGRIYLSWESEGVSTEVGITLVDVLKFVQEKMLE